MEFKKASSLGRRGATCDDIISLAFCWTSLCTPHVDIPTLHPRHQRKKLSVIAFTMRYMARKNLIQFWVSSHFFDSTAPASHSPSLSASLLLLLLLVFCGWMHLNSFYSCVATFAKSWRRREKTNNFLSGMASDETERCWDRVKSGNFEYKYGMVVLKSSFRSGFTPKSPKAFQ